MCGQEKSLADFLASLDDYSQLYWRFCTSRILEVTDLAAVSRLCTVHHTPKDLSFSETLRLDVPKKKRCLSVHQPCRNHVKRVSIGVDVERKKNNIELLSNHRAGNRRKQ